MEIVQLTDLPLGLDAMAREAEDQGHRLVGRLMDEWASGANRFDQPGEALFGANVEGRVVGIGGLNRDPYARDPDVGRVRHLYVLDAFRHQGVGRRLLERIVTAAQGTFRELRLRTHSRYAGQFYERFGFRRIDADAATHVLPLIRGR